MTHSYGLVEHKLRTPNGFVYYWTNENWDKDKDTIFFLHGLTADHTMFLEQIAYFKQDYNLVQSFMKNDPEKVAAFVALDTMPYGGNYYTVMDKWILKQVGCLAYLYPYSYLKNPWQNK